MCVVIYVIIVVTYVITMLIWWNEVTNVIIICDYYMFEWKSKMKAHILQPILNGSLDGWKPCCFCNWSLLFENWGLINFSFTILWWLKHMWHLWNYNICFTINLCLNFYWYFYCLLTLTIQIIIFITYIWAKIYL